MPITAVSKKQSQMNQRYFIYQPYHNPSKSKGWEKDLRNGFRNKLTPLQNELYFEEKAFVRDE